MAEAVDQARRERFEALARTIVEPLRRYLARRTDPATADDVLAETLLVCWRRLDEVPDEALPWCYRVAGHCLANARRGARRQTRLAARIATTDPPATTLPPPGDDAAGDSGPVLDDALAALRQEDAELLRLWAWEQLTSAEIADVLGVTTNAVSIRLHRAKERLRSEVDRRKASGPSGHEQETNERRRS